MKLRWSTGLALVGLLALMLPAGLALADGSHDPQPGPITPHTECVVDGSVDLDGEDETLGTGDDGVTPNRRPGHYVFRDTDLTCEALDGKAKGFSGTYSVRADGDTAGLLTDAKGPGENCDDGHWDEFDINGDGETVGSLTADKVSGNGPARVEGTVKFHRVGSVVTAWGQFTDTDTDKTYDWRAELQFTPTEGICTKDSPITEASLIGTAEIANK